MKRIAFLTLTFLASCGLVSGQILLSGFDRLKEIRFLVADRFEIRQILWDFESNKPDDQDHEEIFSNKDMTAIVSYSSGHCPSEEDDDNESEIFNVPEWRVTQIKIEPKEPIALQDIKIDLKTLKKEQIFANRPGLFMYYAKNQGIAIKVGDDGVEAVFLFPQKKNGTPLCESENARMYASTSWFGDSKLKDRAVIEDSPASVEDLILNKIELPFTIGDMDVDVETEITDPEDDGLVYKYYISVGKIIGEGRKVIWSLKGVTPGTYSITAGVDDGCGICGRTITKTVTIK